MLLSRADIDFISFLFKTVFLTGQFLSEMGFVEEWIDMTSPFTLHLTSSFKAHVSVHVWQIKFRSALPKRMGNIEIKLIKTEYD